MQNFALTWAGLGLLMVAVLPANTSTQEASPHPSDPPFEITQRVLSDSITVFDTQDSIRVFDAERFVESLGDTDVEEDQLIVLETDILFVPMEWALPDSAQAKISELVEKVPEGATVSVHGHTDSLPMPEESEVDNQQLSLNRAEAVAEALRATRPDLDLSVEGFGPDRPAVAEDTDDPDTFAANRRVEIRYE